MLAFVTPADWDRPDVVLEVENTFQFCDLLVAESEGSCQVAFYNR